MEKVAILCCGQGAQFEGMGNNLYNKSQAAKNIMDQLDEYYPNLKKICFDSDFKTLSDTINLQLCLFAVSLMSAAAYKENHGDFVAIAGFSLGEITSLVLSNVLSLKDGIDFVNLRANAMQKCAEQYKGYMAAVLGNKEKICDIIKTINNVYAVNFNSQNQTVISGTTKEMDEAIEILKTNNLRAVKLKVSGPFHTPFMNQAGMEIKNYLNLLQINQPQIPIYSNVTAQIYPNDIKLIKELIVSQVSSPVLWVDIINNMHKNGIDKFVEIGVGNVLTNLNKKINIDFQTECFSETCGG